MTVHQPNTAVTGNSQMVPISPHLVDYVFEANETLLEANKTLSDEKKILQEEKKSLQEKLSQYEEQNKTLQVAAKPGIIIADETLKQLDNFRSRAPDPETLPRLERLATNLSSTLFVLFGADCAETLSNLDPLAPPVNLFGDTDTRNIRNLLTKANLIIYKEYETGFSSYPQDNRDNVTSLIRFSTVSDINETDTTDLDSRFQTDESFRSSLKWLTKIHSYCPQPCQSWTEALAQIYHFETLSCEVTNLLQLTKLMFFLGPSLKLPPEYGDRTIYSDGGWKLDNILVAPFEMNRDIYISGEMVRDPKTLKREIPRLTAHFHQLIRKMILRGYLYGVLSDKETFFFVKLKMEAIQEIMNSQKNIEEPDLPIEIEASHIKDVGPSHLQRTFSWNLKMSEGISELQKQQLERVREFYSKLESNDGGNSGRVEVESSSSKNSSMAPIENEKGLPQISTIDKISHYQASVPVFRVEAPRVTFFEHNLQSHEYLAVKVFSEDWGPVDEIDYFSELKCIHRISQDLEFNNVYFNHDEMSITVNYGESSISGPCLLSKCIETVPLPRNLETYEKAKEQMDILHRNKIYHGNIDESNILYTKEGDVYIKDFSNSIINPEDEGLFVDDFDDLMYLFYHFLPEEIINSIYNMSFVPKSEWSY